MDEATEEFRISAICEGTSAMAIGTSIKTLCMVKKPRNNVTPPPETRSKRLSWGKRIEELYALVSRVNKHFNRKKISIKEIMLIIKQKILILKYSPTVVNPMSEKTCLFKLDSMALLKKEGNFALSIIALISVFEREETKRRAAS